MSEVEREPDWCIVRWHDGDLLVMRQYQWIAQGEHYRHKWEYVARGFKSNEDALQWVSLFKE
jgi:hypothetical protein